MNSTVPAEVFEGYIKKGLAVAPPDISLAGTTRDPGLMLVWAYFYMASHAKRRC